MKVSTVPMENRTLRYSSYLNIASENALLQILCLHLIITCDFYNLIFACTLQFLTRNVIECLNSQVFNCATAVHASHSMKAWA